MTLTVRSTLMMILLLMQANQNEHLQQLWKFFDKIREKGLKRNYELYRAYFKHRRTLS